MGEIQGRYCAVLNSDVPLPNFSTMTIQAVIDREDAKQAYKIGKYKSIAEQSITLARVETKMHALSHMDCQFGC